MCCAKTLKKFEETGSTACLWRRAANNLKFIQSSLHDGALQKLNANALSTITHRHLDRQRVSAQRDTPTFDSLIPFRL